METSFCELRGKEVINISDGKRLGHIIDIVFDTKCGRLLGIVVPCYNKSWNIFKAGDDIFIPFNCICKFGDDAILVQIYIQNQSIPHGRKGKFIRTSSIQTTQNAEFMDTQIGLNPANNKNITMSTNNQPQTNNYVPINNDIKD